MQRIKFENLFSQLLFSIALFLSAADWNRNVFFFLALRLSHSVDAALAALYSYYKFNRLFTHSLNSLRGAYDLRAMWMHVGRLLAFFCSIDGPTTKCLFATCISCARTSIKCTSQRAAEPFNAFERAPFDWPLYGRQADVLYLHRVCFFSPICYTVFSIAANNIFIFYFKLAFLIISFSGA